MSLMCLMTSFRMSLTGEVEDCCEQCIDCMLLEVLTVIMQLHNMPTFSEATTPQAQVVIMILKHWGQVPARGTLA